MNDYFHLHVALECANDDWPRVAKEWGLTIVSHRDNEKRDCVTDLNLDPDGIEPLLPINYLWRSEVTNSWHPGRSWDSSLLERHHTLDYLAQVGAQHLAFLQYEIDRAERETLRLMEEEANE